MSTPKPIDYTPTYYVAGEDVTEAIKHVGEMMDYQTLHEAMAASKSTQSIYEFSIKVVRFETMYRVVGTCISDLQCSEVSKPDVERPSISVTQDSQDDEPAIVAFTPARSEKEALLIIVEKIKTLTR